MLKGVTGMNREMNTIDKFVYWVYMVVMGITR
jgi:hypothetical protein